MTKIKAASLQQALTALETMEQAVSERKEDEHAGAALAAVQHFLSRLREWWRRRTEFDTMHCEDIERMARDLGMTGAGLRDLAARGPDASHLLYERMHVLGLTKADVEGVAQGLMRDLERTCACCREKGACERDLVAQSGSPAWGDYCPNEEVLAAITFAKEGAPA